MRAPLVLAAILLVLTLLLSGCGMVKEPEDTAFVTVVGIDKAEGNNFDITYRFDLARALAPTQGGAKLPDVPSVLTTITAPNTAEGYNLLSTTNSRVVNLTHMKALLISEEVARSGVLDLFGPLMRYREYRGSMFVCVVRGRVQDYMHQNRPVLDMLPAKYYESMMDTADEASYYIASDIHNFYLGLKNPGHSAHATLIGPNPMTGEAEPQKKATPNYRVDTYLAGDIPRSGSGNHVEFAGTAIFSGDRMVGTLDTRQTRILAMFYDELPQGFWVLSDPQKSDKLINVNMRNGRKPKIEASLVNGQATFKVSLFLEGEITGVTSGIDYERREAHALLEKHIAEIFTAGVTEFIRYTQSVGSDVAGFGYHLRPHFVTYQELRQVNMEELYKNAAIDVTVVIKLRRTGLMQRTSPAKPGIALQQGE